MSIAATVLDSGYDQTDAASYVTASVAPAANSLTFVIVSTSGTTGPGSTAPLVSSVTGAGVTWRDTFQFVSLDLTKRLQFYRGLEAAPGSGALTIGLGSVSEMCSWAVIQHTGTVTTGLSGQDGIHTFQIVQGASVTSIVGTFLATGMMSDHRQGAVFLHQKSEGTLKRPGWTELTDLNGGATAPDVGVETQFNATFQEDFFSASWATAADVLAIGWSLIPAGESFNLDSLSTWSHPKMRNSLLKVGKPGADI